MSHGMEEMERLAINSKAHIRHVHRPPQVPSDRSPHCRWELTVDDDNETPPEADITAVTRMTTAATFEFASFGDGTTHVPEGRAQDGSASRGSGPGGRWNGG
ncbi:MAG: hypothetical protein ACLQPH_00695 [Acidimicrobiales bacterium]